MDDSIILVIDQLLQLFRMCNWSVLMQWLRAVWQSFPHQRFRMLYFDSFTVEIYNRWGGVLVFEEQDTTMTIELLEEFQESRGYSKTS
jgi:hypothetical protein